MKNIWKYILIGLGTIALEWIFLAVFATWFNGMGELGGIIIGAAFFLAFEQERAVGFAQCQLRHDYVEGTDSSPVGYLEGIYVADGYRKQGIAKAHLKACENWAKTKGCSEFASDCELSNLQSLHFHLSMGFEEANRIVCFTKKL